MSDVNPSTTTESLRKAISPFVRSFAFFINISSSQNRAFSLFVARTIAFAPKTNRKPTTDWNRPAALDIPTSPSCIRPRYTYVSIVCVTLYNAPEFCGT